MPGQGAARPPGDTAGSPGSRARRAQTCGARAHAHPQGPAHAQAHTPATESRPHLQEQSHRVTPPKTMGGEGRPNEGQQAALTPLGLQQGGAQGCEEEAAAQPVTMGTAQPPTARLAAHTAATDPSRSLGTRPRTAGLSGRPVHTCWLPLQKLWKEAERGLCPPGHTVCSPAPPTGTASRKNRDLAHIPTRAQAPDGMRLELAQPLLQPRGTRSSKPGLH